jgi:dienelactone hydrolase
MMKRFVLFAFLICGFLITACGGSNPPASSGPTTILQPLALPGPYTVACSNVVQDFSLVPPGEEAKEYWEGFPSASGAPQYMTDLLANPADALSVTVTAPDNEALYGSFAGEPVQFVVIACYPTVATNPNSDYPLPTGKVVPHMQTGSEPPLFADDTARYPVLAFSHGYGGSPISNDYIDALSWFASYGYVVVAPFHGDPRFSNLKIEDLPDAVKVLSHLSDFVALQALRPLSMSAAIDLVLANPQYGDHVDATQIGGFGASLGGETFMLMGGAGLTTSLVFDWTQVTVDPRIKAAVGYIPYFGQPFLPSFGRDQHGLDGITLPYLAISGTADTTAPLDVTREGISRLAGTKELVALVGVKHGLSQAAVNDIFTWSLTFLNAEVRGQPTAQQQLSTMASVAGGVDDYVVIPYNGP